jgi:hypothetical protein
MALNIEFTDKAQATVQAAIQLAKDYANSQRTSVSSLTLTPSAYQATHVRSISRTPRICTFE